MASPIWKTRKGNLGKIQEQEFYELDLNAIDPDGGNITYKIISGSLPPGLLLTSTGTISGFPKDRYGISGVPFDVAEDITSTFCCRATSSSNQISDRTFSITVTGQDAPEIITPDQRLATVFDGSYVNIQLTAIDLDNEPISWSLASGALPPGLDIDKNTGIISGYVEPSFLYTVGERLGWSSVSGWDEDPWDNNSRAISKTYEFKISVTDGKSTDIATYSIFVISRDSTTTDNDSIVLDPTSDFISADSTSKHIPVIITPSGDIGVYAYDNYFAYQFRARDFDGDIIEFSLLVGENIGFDNEISGFDSTPMDFGDYELPPGLELSTETGWLYGYIPAGSPAQREYTFGVRVYKRDYPEYISDIVPYTITLVGDINYFVQWTTGSDLGEIYTGDISELSVQATNILGRELFFTLEPGREGGRLPQGLSLLSNGLIAGRPSFEVTSFDKGALTLDKNVREMGQILPETTIDRKFTFTVRAADREEYIVAYKQFTVTIIPGEYAPYESLYLRAYPGLEDKAIYESIVFSNEIIPDHMVYRLGDPYFGKQNNINMLLISGLNSKSASEYIQAMAINHYRKSLALGSVKVAQALDDIGNVKYEVVYLSVYDQSLDAPNSIDLRRKITRNITTDNNIKIDSNYMNINTYDSIIYPNGLRAMRKQIRDSIGYVDREILPGWMTSKQKDGRISYWIPGAVLAYVKPGFGEQVKFYIDRVADLDFKDISFEVDRYIWDNNLSKNFDIVTGTFAPSLATTFDEDIRTGSDDLIFVENGDGSTSVFDLGFLLVSGTVKIEIEKYILLSDSSLVLDRSVLNEDAYMIDNSGSTTIITFDDVPEDNSVIYITYTNNQVLEVDSALSVPFNKIDGMTKTYIDTVIGGFDNVVQDYVGKRVIFARQEQYPGYIESEDGWIRNLTTWDENLWNDTSVGFDDYEIIPGYVDSLDGSSINQRAGIWLVTLDSDNKVRLVFDQEVMINQRVRIKNGSLFGGKILRLGPLINFDIGETVPRYNQAGVVDQGNATIFDGGYTRFIDGISEYEEPDQGDKYLIFPRTNIFA